MRYSRELNIWRLTYGYITAGDTLLSEDMDAVDEHTLADLPTPLG